MTTYNTGNPIGSTDSRDRLDNSENFDIALNTHDATWVDRLGVTRDSFEGALSKLSFYRVGTFAAGYTLTNMRQTLEHDGHEYSWAGTFPKVVAAGATPATSGGIGDGAWVDRTDVTLRGELLSGAMAIRNSQLSLRDVVSVKDFGATGDGITDDTAAIQAALDAGLGDVVLPDGDFKISAPLDMNDDQAFIGLGGRLVTENLSFINAVNVTNRQNVRIRGINIVGPSGGNGFDSAIEITNSHGVTIENCLIKDIGNEAVTPNEWGHGIEIGGASSNVKILNNTIKNIKGYGQFRGDGITLRSSSNTLIQGNTIDTTRRMQIAITDDATDVKIIGNHLLNGYLDGIDVEPNSVNTTGEIAIQGNTIRNFGSKPGATIGAQYHGIDLHSNEFDNISITGNIITAENAQAIACIHGENIAKYATISSNVLVCNGYCGGITLSAGNGFKNLIIANNVIREFDVYGIQGDKTATTLISNNIIESSQATAAVGVQLVTGTSDPTFVTISGNNIKLGGGAAVAGIFTTGLTGLSIGCNIVTVDAGNGVEVYSNIAGMVGMSISGNMVINTNAGVNAYYFRSAGTGAIQNCEFNGNLQSGFTTPVLLSGSVTFVKDAVDTYFGTAAVGNNNVTLTAGAAQKVILFNAPITAARTVTLSTANAQNGDSFRIVRTAACTGAFSINVGTSPLKALTAAGQWCDVTYTGAAWVLTAYGDL